MLGEGALQLSGRRVDQRLEGADLSGEVGCIGRDEELLADVVADQQRRTSGDAALRLVERAETALRV